MQPKSWLSYGPFYAYSSSLNIPNTFAVLDFLRIILNACMVCGYVCNAKLDSLLYSSPFSSDIILFLGVQETALPLRPVLLSIPSCQDAPGPRSPCLWELAYAAASMCNTLQPTLCLAYSYLHFRAQIKCHYSRKPSLTLPTA